MSITVTIFTHNGMENITLDPETPAGQLSLYGSPALFHEYHRLKYLNRFCTYCGQVLPDKISTKQFCQNDYCRLKYNAANKIPSKKICPNCEQEFTPVTKRAIYCSAKCRTAFKTKK